MKRRLLLLILVAVLLAPLHVALASPELSPLRGETVREGTVHRGDLSLFGDTLTVESGARVDGNVVLFGGHATIDGDVDGDLTSLGGNSEIGGAVEGDVVVMGGNVTLTEGARVEGECVLIGGTISGAEAIGLECNRIGSELSFFLGGLSDQAGLGFTPSRPQEPILVSREPSPFARLIFVGGQAFGLAMLALIAASLAPQHLRRVGQAIAARPVVTGTVGALTAAAGSSILGLLFALSTFLILLCGIGLLGFPILFVLSVLLVGAGLFGWFAIGGLLGQRLSDQLRWTPRSLPVTTAMGTGVLSLALGLVSLLPAGDFFAPLLFVALGCVGLGAAALTQFGRRDYPQPALAPTASKLDEVLSTLPDDDKAA